MDNKPVFGLVTGMISFCFSLLLLSFVTLNFSQYRGESPWKLIVILVFIVLENLFDLYLFLKKDQNHVGRSKLRGVIIIGFIAYIFVSFIGKPILIKSFIPDIVNLAALITIIISSFVGYSIRYPIFIRNDFYTFVANNSTKSLMETLNSEPQMVTALFRGVVSLRSKSYLIITIATLFLILNSYLNTTPWILSVSYFFLLVSSLGLVALSNIFIDEHKFFSFGSITPITYKQSRLNLAYVVIIVAAVPALLFSINTAIFPNLIGDFLNWYMHLVQYQPPTPQTTPQPEDIQTDIGLSSITPFQQESPNRILPILMEIGKYSILAILIGFIVYFLLRPLFKIKISYSTIIRRIFEQIRDLVIFPFLAFLKFIQQIFTFSWRNKKTQSILARLEINPRQYFNSLLKSRKNLKKNKQILTSNRSLILYFKYLQWAYNLGIRWSLSDTPVDIADKTAYFLSLHIPKENFQNQKIAIFELTDLLEQDLFSRENINHTDLKTMENDIQNLLSLKLNL